MDEARLHVLADDLRARQKSAASTGVTVIATSSDAASETT
jgi:hypothetical protein